MRTTLFAAVVATALLAGSKAEAQYGYARGSSLSYSYASAPYAPAYPAGYPATYLPRYSYYAAPDGYPARVYSGYGAGDFPFYGQPYGHVYDRWTWNYLSAEPFGGVLNRYYYPPVR